MAPQPKFPLVNTPISFSLVEDYGSTGECQVKGGCDATKDSTFEGLTEKFFRELLVRRQEVMEARQKFKEFDVQAMKSRFPDWKGHHDLVDIRAQFQSLDLNQDGLVDFHELCIVLDELGDRSPVRVRKKYFGEIDIDGSGAVDFEEFVSLLYTIDKKRIAAAKMQKNKKTRATKMDNLSVLCKEGCENTQRVRKLSVAQQINNGLF